MKAFYSTFNDFFSLMGSRERGKEGEGEGEKHRCEREKKHWLIDSYMRPDWGLNPQSRHVSWPGVNPVTFQLANEAQPTEHIGQGAQYFLKKCLESDFDHLVFNNKHLKVWVILL